MVLKINLNGKKVPITGVGRPLITFINGEKKRLTRGITFVNGQKKVLWDIHSLQIDYLTGMYQLSGNKELYPVFVNDTKLVLSTSDSNIIKYNIENISNPSVESTVMLGQVCGISLPDSTNFDLVYYAVVNNSKAPIRYAVQQINIKIATCEITASNTISFSNIPGQGGLLGTDKWLGWKFTNSANVLTFYLNDTEAYNYSYNPSSTISVPAAIGPFLSKRDPVIFVGTKPSATVGASAIAVYSATGVQERVSGVDYTNVMAESNGNIVAAGRSGFGLYDQRFDLIKQVPITSANRSCSLVGRIRDYYYVVEAPIKEEATDKKVYLRIFDAATGELFEQHTLNLPEITNWSYVKENLIMRTIPQISKTGSLVFVWVPGGTATAGQNTVVVRIQGY